MRDVRECPICPPWVIRCAHYRDDHVLYLASRTVLAEKHFANWPKEYGVYVVCLKDLSPCSCGCGQSLPLGVVPLPHGNYVTLRGAQSFFFATERRLLEAAS